MEDCGHKIIKSCFVEQPKCTFKCLDLLDCGHACELNCHKNVDPHHEEVFFPSVVIAYNSIFLKIISFQYECKRPCEKINSTCPLKHKCQKLCHENCFECTVKINKTLPCGHIQKDVSCYDQNIKCLSQCDRFLMCDHKCPAMCFEKCQPCEIQVSKLF